MHVVLPCNALEHKAPMKAFATSIRMQPYGFHQDNMVHLVIVKNPLDISRTLGYRVDGVFGSDIQPP
jgi:hypothetical protein